MFYLCLLSLCGLAMADTSRLCDDGKCPAGWRDVEGDCVMFMSGWEEDSARQVCRGLKAEFSEFFISQSDSDSATRHSLPVCLFRREIKRNKPLPGFIITGGNPESSNKKVEVYNPSSGKSCPLPDLKVGRWGHSSCSGLVCGGQGSPSTSRSCERITTDLSVSPLPSLTLTQARAASLCWSLPGDEAIMLFGGWFSQATAEVVSGSSSSDGSFGLPYNTRAACGISVGETFIVTGGLDGTVLNTVAKYSQSGFLEYLPAMNQRRFSHACSSFTSDSGETVLLVTGGGHKPGGTETRLDSTEILLAPGGSWRTLTTASLPSPRWALQAGTINNVVFVFGGYDGSNLNTILSFNKTEESWQPAGEMTVGRHWHAVTQIQDVSQHCP